MKTPIDVKPLSDREFSVVHQHLIHQETYFISGSNSMYVPSERRRYINERIARTWPNLDGIPELMTPGAAARVELQRAFPDLKRVGWRPKMIQLFDHRPPMLYTGPHNGDMVQVDLKSAYWQIYRLLWLNTPYPRGFGSLSLMPVAEALEGWKQARNAVVGLCASRETVGIRGKKRYALKTRNQFLSPGLWASIQMILHTIAHVAAMCNALYINTDGYIFYSNSLWQAFTEWLNGEGLMWEFKGIGDGTITGWNSYKVGDRSTQIFKLRLEAANAEFSNIQTGDIERWTYYLTQCRRLATGG